MMLRLILIVIGLATAPAIAAAQDRLQSSCIALAQADAPIIPATFGADLAENTLRVRYLDHATFLLETEGGLIAATDYTGFLGVADIVPDVVTMNNAHSTHFTDTPDPRIPHVLRGWPLQGVPARLSLDLGEMLVRNVTTNTRGPFGEGAVADGNSIFIFEVAGLCIGHLGHLHQKLSPPQMAAIGRLDVVMVPVDDAYTLPLADMADVVRNLRARVVLPMHYFSQGSLDAFVRNLEPSFQVVRLDQPDIELSRDNLPAQPTIIVLEPAFLD
jgi:L-ascorbate metabolism protein UlaG (beta-lactamase superfamily)